MNSTAPLYLPSNAVICDLESGSVVTRVTQAVTLSVPALHRAMPNGIASEYGGCSDIVILCVCVTFKRQLLPFRSNVVQRRMKRWHESSKG